MHTLRSALLLVALGAAPVAADELMVDPSIDDPARPWCYMSKSTTVLGVPYMPDVTQVTFDGALYTRSAELCFFTGTPLRPILARQKQFLEGWIPIIRYAWADGRVVYDIEMFSAVLDGESEANTCQFVRLSMRNTSREPTVAELAAATRRSGVDHRYGKARAARRYEMTDDAVVRDSRLIYAFSAGAQRETVPGVAYDAPFVGQKYGVSAQTATCLVRYRRQLEPGEEFSAVFKMPRVPVPTNDAELVRKIRSADYGRYRAAVERYWRDLFASGSQFEIPEPRVNEALRASLVHLMLATRERGGKRFQTSGLPYANFFLIDYIDMRMAYDAMGQPEFSRENLGEIFDRQMDDGLFCDTSLSHGKRLWSSHGHMIHSLAHHCLMQRDWKLAREIYPRLERAVRWVDDARKSDAHGLMPPAWPYDAEMIKGRYTSHNLWSLLGLRSAIRLARALDSDGDVAEWTRIHDEYETDVLKAIRATCGDDGYVPTGLYDFITGPASRAGFREYQTDQDWENLVLAYPTEVLAPHDPRIAATLERMHRLKYREGIMTYRNGMHLHQYLTTNVTNQHILRGEQKEALIDLYHILLHCGPTHEGYENMIRPWQHRDTDGGAIPPPHAWAAAKITLLIRNLLVLAHGGRAGLDASERDLLLFSAISPAWAEPGRKIVIRDAATEFGPVHATMRFTDDGATVAFANRFHTPPRDLVVRVPYFVNLRGFESNAVRARRDGDTLRLSPDATRLTLTWRSRAGVHDRTLQDLLLRHRREAGFWPGKQSEHPEPPKGSLTNEEKAHPPARLGFDTVLAAYQHEYRRRFAKHVAAGGRVVSIEAPPLTSGARTPVRVDPAVQGIAVNARVTASASLPEYPPELAVDGDAADLASSWQTDPYPAWLQIDLEKPTEIRRVHVFPYRGGGRCYRYVVEVSEDGEAWRTVADQSGNDRPATRDGDDHRFAPRTARYVRVRMLYHSLNRGVHLVEVRVF